MKAQEKSLGELLKQAGKVSQIQIQTALNEQKKTQEPFGKILVRLGFVAEADILQVMEGMMILTLQTGGELFGIETFRIKEVLRYLPWHPLPSLHPDWSGLLSLRGTILPVLSFRRLLGLGAPPSPPETWYVVLQRQNQTFVLWVDEVRDVKRLKTEQIEPLPAYLFGKKSEFYYCLGKIGDELYSVINPDRLVPDKSLSAYSTEVNHATPS